MRYALAALSLLALGACESVPEGVAANEHEARVYGFALVRTRADGTVDIQPEPASLAIQKWLYEHDYGYSYFDPDTSSAVNRLLAPLQEGRPPGEGVVSGYSVYRR
jgi:hypothetical protein